MKQGEDLDILNITYFNVWAQMVFLLLMYIKGPETDNEKHQSQGLRWNLGCANRPKKYLELLLDCHPQAAGSKGY